MHELRRMMWVAAVAAGVTGCTTHPLCQQAAQKQAGQVKALGCAQDDSVKLQSKCEDAYQKHPGCSTKLDTFISCAIADNVPAHWACGSSGSPELATQVACTQEKASMDACTSSGGGPISPVPGPPIATNLVFGLTDAFDFALDSTQLYFFTASELHRCPLAGCTTTQKLTGPVAVPSSLAVSNGRLYWTQDFRRIMSCDVSQGSCTPQMLTDVGDQSYPTQLLAQGTLLYWISNAGPVRRVQVCPLTGCSAGYPKAVLDGPAILNDAPTSGLAMDATHLFISSFTGALYRFSMSGPETVDATSGAQIANLGYGNVGLNLDGTNLLHAQSAEGKVRSCAAPDCATMQDIQTQLTAPFGFKANSSARFWLIRGTPNGTGTYAPSTGGIWSLPR